ncbi:MULTISPECIES: HlyD family secretion protein [Shewanella]|uniref:HlyD family secretion protein n=1 Tax=Shewanella TaxID=22 RepID=UPI00048F7DD1|nr:MULTISPECIES: HlyD family secretion protein [Shewanella]QLE84797.1 HlyD family secretion protein [Shewanella sp. Scap07]
MSDQAKTEATTEAEPSTSVQPTDADTQASQAKTNKIRKATNYLLIFATTMFAFHLIADRFIPSTDLGRVRAFVVPISPQVSGEIVDILVTPNTLVQEGEILARVNSSDYEIAVNTAEQKLKQAGQNMGAQTANVTAAQAKVTNAIANFKNAQVQSKRVFAMADRGVMSQADADNARASLTSAEAAVAAAKADLAKAEERLGMEGDNNTQVKSALLALQQAQLNLQRTDIRAPTAGTASNFRLKEGVFANKGQPLMTFISVENVWIEAYFRENSLGNMNAGDKVEFALDYAPGKVFQGTVGSIDYGIDWGQNEQVGKLATVSGQTGWLRQSQRFPVTIVFDEDQAKGLKRVGGQADVIVYTKDDGLFNLIGKAYIRIVSWLSYVR